MKLYRYITSMAVLCLTGCTNSLIDRSLIFSTHTSLGIEVSVNPAEMDAPAKLQIGYKRTEGVLNPVYYNLDKGAQAGADRKVTDYYRQEAYSVIAKFEGTATAGGEASADTKVATGKTDATGKEIPGATGVVSANVKGGMTLSQWFATGEAATILARYGAPALSDNPGVAAAAAAASRQAFSDRVLALPSDVRATFHTSVYEMLVTMNTPESNKRVTALDNAAAAILTVDRIDIPAEYVFNPTTKDLIANPPVVITRNIPAFRAAITRLNEMEKSLKSLKEAKLLAGPPATVTVPAATGVQFRDFVAPNKVEPDRFEKTIQFYQQTADRLRKDLAALPEFQTAARYLAEQLGLKE